jgi:hypothetical protein
MMLVVNGSIVFSQAPRHLRPCPQFARDGYLHDLIDMVFVPTGGMIVIIVLLFSRVAYDPK